MSRTPTLSPHTPPTERVAGAEEVAEVVGVEEAGGVAGAVGVRRSLPRAAVEAVAAVVVVVAVAVAAAVAAAVVAAVVAMAVVAVVVAVAAAAAAGDAAAAAAASEPLLFQAAIRKPFYRNESNDPWSSPTLLAAHALLSPMRRKSPRSLQLPAQRALPTPGPRVHRWRSAHVRRTIEISVKRQRL